MADAKPTSMDDPTGTKTATKVTASKAAPKAKAKAKAPKLVKNIAGFSVQHR